MRVLLVRHGETEANIQKRYSGWTDYPLTGKGKRQIVKLREVLCSYKIDKIYSSPLGRAIATASYIASPMKKNIFINHSLKEINFGIFEDKTAKEIASNHEEEWGKWIDDYVNYTIPEGESLKDVHNRTQGFLEELKGSSKTYLIVSHGGVIQVLITQLLGLPIKDIWKFKVEPGSLVEIQYENNFGILIKMLNENS